MEADRDTILQLESVARGVYVQKAVLEQQIRLISSPRLCECNLAKKQVSCTDVPWLGGVLVSAPFAPRVAASCLEGHFVNGVQKA